MKDTETPFRGINAGKYKPKFKKPCMHSTPILIYLMNDKNLLIYSEGTYHDTLGQISIELFNKGLKDIGYELVKIKTKK